METTRAPSGTRAPGPAATIFPARDDEQGRRDEPVGAAVEHPGRPEHDRLPPGEGAAVCAKAAPDAAMARKRNSPMRSLAIMSTLQLDC